MRLFGYAMFGLGLGLLLLAGATLVFDLGVLKPLYERVASHYLQREVRVEGEMSVRLGRSVTASAAAPSSLRFDGGRLMTRVSACSKSVTGTQPSPCTSR